MTLARFVRRISGSVNRAGEKIFFGIEPDADSIGNAPATAFALVGAGLGDLLDRQPLDFAARRVAADTRQARIDDVTNAGDGQRRLCDIGCQHDSAPIVGLKDAHLFVGAEASEEGEDFGGRGVMGAQGFCGFTNFALAGEEDEDVADVS